MSAPGSATERRQLLASEAVDLVSGPLPRKGRYRADRSRHLPAMRLPALPARTDGDLTSSTTATRRHP